MCQVTNTHNRNILPHLHKDAGAKSDRGEPQKKLDHIKTQGEGLPENKNKLVEMIQRSLIQTVKYK